MSAYLSLRSFPWFDMTIHLHYLECECSHLLGLFLSRLTTLRQAAGNDEGLKVKVIDEQDEVGKGKGEDAESE